MLLLDTNVLSALIQPILPDGIAALRHQRAGERTCTAAVCEAEIRAGVAALPQGRRRQKLEQDVLWLFNEAMAGDVLAFDRAAAAEYAAMIARRRRAGRPGAELDVMIAAIARVHGATVVTRNAGDFDHCGVDVLNPWDD